VTTAFEVRREVTGERGGSNTGVHHDVFMVSVQYWGSEGLRLGGHIRGGRGGDFDEGAEATGHEFSNRGKSTPGLAAGHSEGAARIAHV